MVFGGGDGRIIKSTRNVSLYVVRMIIQFIAYPRFASFWEAFACTHICYFPVYGWYARIGIFGLTHSSPATTAEGFDWLAGL